MRYSKTAITELTKRYKKILKKCALFNAAILVGIMTIASTNAKANDWITIDGQMFSPTGYYLFRQSIRINIRGRLFHIPRCS